MNQAAESMSAAAGTVVNDAKILGALFTKSLEHLAGQARVSEAAQQNRGAVENVCNCFPTSG
jgi:hypothetical protein